jgi:hypothetical protein
VSRAYPKCIIEDFDAVRSYFETAGILPDPIPPEKGINCRQIHYLTYCLILWKFRLRKVPEHSKPFIDEIASDALQILPHTLMGYTKTAKLLIRSIIENVCRHIYFHDHTVEFELMNREQKWFMTMTDLFEYLRKHPRFLDSERKFAAISQLSDLYSYLSGGIHGRTVSDLMMHNALRDIAYDPIAARKIVEALKQCTAATNFLIARFHCAQTQAFPLEDRRIILRSMPDRARQVWAED